MPVSLFSYGTEHCCVRIGLQFCLHPLVYAAYTYNYDSALPNIPGQTYRGISRSQYDWLLNHLMCDIRFSEETAGWPSLECLNHKLRYSVFDNEESSWDGWEDRSV